MLPYSVRVVWFALSLAGLLGSWATLPLFPGLLSLPGWIPLFYGVADTVLQGIFCLGLVWRMDPFRMPRGFCIAQTILTHVAWAALSGLCASVALSTAAAVFSSRPRFFRTATRMPATVTLVIVFPTIVFVLQLALVLRLDAALPADGMSCDATHPIWVRTLGYAGLTLALAAPSFVLSLLTALRLLFKPPRASPAQNNLTSHSHPLSKSRPASHALSSQAPLTPLPARRSRIREAKPRASLFDSPLVAGAPETKGRGSPYHSPSPLLFPRSGMPDSPGRAPSLAKHSRFHLPFDVPPPPSPTRSVPPQVRDSPVSVTISLPGQGRDSPLSLSLPLPSPRAPAYPNAQPNAHHHTRLDSNQSHSQSHSPSPIIFANRSRTGSQTTTVVVRVGPSPSPIPVPTPPSVVYANTGVSLSAGAGESREVVPGLALSPGLSFDGGDDGDGDDSNEDLFSDEDAVLEGPPWTEDGDDVDAKPDRRSAAKDSLMYDEDDADGEGDAPSLYALAPYPRIRRLASGQPPWLDAEDGAPACESALDLDLIPGRRRGLVCAALWALGTAATITLAAVSSLVDVARGAGVRAETMTTSTPPGLGLAPKPEPLGTQHVALLLAAWGPCLVVLVVLVRRGCARVRAGG